MNASKRVVLFAALVAAAIASSFPYFLSDLAQKVGDRQGLPDPLNDYFKGWLWAAIIGAGISFMPFKSGERNLLLFFWAARCVVTLVFMLPYENTYTLDAFIYVERAANADPFNPGSFGSGIAPVVTFCSFLYHFVPTLNSYHALKVIHSFIGLIAVYLIYLTTVVCFEFRSLKTLACVGLFPSVLFWSSILGKDPIQLFGIALFMFGFAKFVKDRSLAFMPVFLCGVWIAATIRVWSAGILLLPVLVVVLLGNAKLMSKITLMCLVVLGSMASATTLIEKYKVETVDDMLSTANNVSRSWSSGGSGQEVPEFSDLPSMIKFLPFGIFTALYRPLPGEINNPFGVLAGLESLMLLIMSLLCVRRIRAYFWKDPIFLWTSSTIAIWSSVYAFISFQNLGTGFRFRLQILPFFIVGILCSLKYIKPPKIGTP